MKLAYLLLLHKNPVQVSKLIANLISADVYIIIHVDGKTEISPFIEIINKNQYNNVYFCKNRVNVNWSGFSMVEATVSLMKELIDRNIKPDYVTLLSGQDFPLKTNEEIRDFFIKNNGKNFIQYFKIPIKLSNEDGNGFERILYWHWIDRHGTNKARKIRKIQQLMGLKRKYPKGIEPYIGSQWWSLQYECIEFLYAQCNENNKIYKFYKHTYVPDELFFHTLIMNSQFKESVENENMRFVNWNNGWVKNLTQTDWHNISNSKYLFARKFDVDCDSKIINYLEIKRNKEIYRKQFEYNFIKNQ